MFMNHMGRGALGIWGPCPTGSLVQMAQSARGAPGPVVATAVPSQREALGGGWGIVTTRLHCRL
jgi:hypothetical protein